MKTLSIQVFVTQVRDEAPVAVIRAKGSLDAFTYMDFIAKVQNLYQRGERNLVLDMRGLSEIGLAGLFALCDAALIFQGEAPLNPEEGWAALEAVSERLRRQPHEHFKLFKPQPRVTRAVISTGLPIYDDLSDALLSFVEPDWIVYPLAMKDRQPGLVLS